MRFQSVAVIVAALFASACSHFQGSRTTPEVAPVSRVEGAEEAPGPDAAALRDSGRLQQAAAAYRTTLVADPANTAARYGLADTLRQLGESEAAKEEYLKVAENDAFRAKALEGIGLVDLAAGEHNAAFETLNSAVEADPKLWRAWLGLAQLSDLGRDWTRSDEAYAKALAATDKPTLVRNNYGISKLARGDAKGAADEFNQALAIDPNFERAKTNLDLANAADGRSISDLAEAETDPKKRAQLLNNYGYVAMLQGRYDDAETYFNAALKAHPAFYKPAFENLNVLKSLKAQAQK